ncbi:hypothetical protein FRB99_008707 [Tulasnella sp. 403]|nr:hypothetical protein FRB99_008707 [Tulasnella sp. 403]
MQPQPDTVLRIPSTPLHVVDDPFGFRPPVQPDKIMASSPYLTPPHSALELSPECNAPDFTHTQISISTTFYPGATFARELVDTPADLVVQSVDGVFFYVHSSVLRARSNNNFAGLLGSSSSSPATLTTNSPDSDTTNVYIKTPLLTPEGSEPTPPVSPSSTRRSPSPSTSKTPPSLPLLVSPSEPAATINIVLHLLYGLSFQRYSPDFDTLSQVFPFARKYGLSVTELAPPTSELCGALLGLSLRFPLQVYALAAQNKLHELAVMASQFTLNHTLASITDQLAIEMGPVYLKRLFFLHNGRAEALKRILVRPLETHPLGQGDCDADDQKALSRAWGLGTAYILSMNALQNLSVGTFNSTYGPMLNSGYKVSSLTARRDGYTRFSTTLDPNRPRPPDPHRLDADIIQINTKNKAKAY